jgi:hypothetical protein
MREPVPKALPLQTSFSRTVAMLLNIVSRKFTLVEDAVSHAISSQIHLMMIRIQFGRIWKSEWITSRCARPGHDQGCQLHFVQPHQRFGTITYMFSIVKSVFARVCSFLRSHLRSLRNALRLWSWVCLVISLNDSSRSLNEYVHTDILCHV